MNTEYNEKHIKKLSRLCSLLLRHAPEKADIKLDENGWVTVDELIEKVSQHYFPINRDLLNVVVTTNDKQRFTFSDDHLRIRANQGHSVNVDLALEELAPPDFLYHGTASKHLDSILENGINKGSRHDVHLSTVRETAMQVGSRHGRTVVLYIDAKGMHNDGFKFYRSKNGVWLTDFIPSKYIRR